mgnify:CR=1 FL=1
MNMTKSLKKRNCGKQSMRLEDRMESRLEDRMESRLEDRTESRLEDRMESKLESGYSRKNNKEEIEKRKINRTDSR